MTQEIKFKACKLCRCTIDDMTGIECGYGCEQDGTHYSERPKDTWEIRVYTFARTEPAPL